MVDALTPIMSLTPAALAHVQKWINKQAGIGFRVGVKKTGCSGLAYVTEIIHEVPEKHLLVSFPSPIDETVTIHVYIEEQSLPYLKGLYIDYGKANSNDKNLLNQQPHLIFINPNETATCGCGESFTVK